MPLVFLLALLVMQVGLVGKDQLLVAHAAREAARSAAVLPESESASQAAKNAGGLEPELVDVSLTGGSNSGDQVTAEVHYQSRTELPLVGRYLPDVNLEAAVTMRVE